jgi:hypothetical protein
VRRGAVNDQDFAAAEAALFAQLRGGWMVNVAIRRVANADVTLGRALSLLGKATIDKLWLKARAEIKAAQDARTEAYYASPPRERPRL